MQLVIRYNSRVGDARLGSQKPKPTTDWCCLAGRLRKHAPRQLGACAASSLALSLVEDTVQLEPSFQPELGWRTDFWDIYQMGRVIGSGSFGQVHAGVHRESGLPVAIKTLTKVRGKLPRDRTLERLNREAGILQRLQPCDGVIRLLGCFEEQDMVHVVTELCPSGDLARFVEVNGPVTERQLALVALQVLKVVQACHSHGIIHGDVKPNNFCLRGAQQRQLLQEDAPCSSLRAIDFGCAQSIGSQRCSNRMGTPVYMAPEIFARSYSHKVDIWSMGIMLYWLFCGKFPFFKDANALNKAQLDEVANAVTNDPITYNFGPWQEISTEGLDFVRSCLTRPEEARMDTSGALQHPWFQMYLSPEELLGQRPGSARTPEEPALELPWYLQIVLPWN